MNSAIEAAAIQRPEQRTPPVRREFSEEYAGISTRAHEFERLECNLQSLIPWGSRPLQLRRDQESYFPFGGIS
jgi:hypothetical protein